MENLFRDQLVVVTGARGFIGSHVADQLVKCGARVRGLTRSLAAPRGLFGADVDWFEADLTDPATLVEPFRDCRYVFHVAGDYRFWARNPQTIFRNNVEGTDHVLRAAVAVGAEKIVVTSTQGILQPGSREQPGTEENPVDPAELHGPYKSSKLAASEVVERYLAAGAPILSVLPGAPIGENDLRPTPTGAIIVQFINGKLPFLARTGLSLVDVADVARGHLQALERGSVGEKYLLAGQNLWLGEFLKMIEPWAGRSAPRFHAPPWISRAAAAFSEGWQRVSGSEAEPFITRESVRMSERPYFFSSEKAVRELRYHLSPLENAIERAVHDFRKRGLLGK